MLLREEAFVLSEPLIGACEQRELDQLHTRISGLPLLLLMEQAAAAVFHLLRERFNPEKNTILILCGPGNNGGDGWALARLLLAVDAKVTVADFSPDRKLAAEAEQMRTAARQLHVPVVEIRRGEDLGKLPQVSLIADCLLGTGFTVQRGLPAIVAEASQWTAACRQNGTSVLSIDIPSGVDSDSGAVDEFAFQADLTATFMYRKRGIAFMPGALNAGEIAVLPVGLRGEDRLRLPFRAITAPMVRAILPERSPLSHKGTFGSAVLFAGSERMPGALLLAAEAALRAGPGYLYIISSERVRQQALWRFPECLQEDECDLEACSRLLEGRVKAAAGPGWGKGKEELLKRILDSACELILDADALNLLAGNQELRKMLRQRGQRLAPGATLLTPHPGEFARLFPELTELLKSDPAAAALKAAEACSCPLLLKGSHSILALPDGRVFVNTKACSGLARAGSGDVLCGLILGLCVQDLSLTEAALAGIYLHNRAALRLSRKTSAASMRVGELAQMFSEEMLSLRENSVL